MPAQAFYSPYRTAFGVPDFHDDQRPRPAMHNEASVEMQKARLPGNQISMSMSPKPGADPSSLS
jgi:hypothetical protein